MEVAITRITSDMLAEKSTRGLIKSIFSNSFQKIVDRDDDYVTIRCVLENSDDSQTYDLVLNRFKPGSSKIDEISYTYFEQKDIDFLKNALESNPNVYVEYCYLDGNLNCSGMSFETIILFNSFIRGVVSFKGSKFKGKSDSAFKDRDESIFGKLRSKFKGCAAFSSSTFNGYANFNSTFEKDAFFLNSTFKENADFNDSVFVEAVDFNNSVFEKETSFLNSTFNGYANFDNCIFTGCIHFNSISESFAYSDGSVFKTDVSFKKVKFKEYANFVKSRFEGNADFGDSIFEEDVIFKGSTFKGEVEFLRSKFKKTAQFWQSTFGGRAEFIGSTFGGKADLRSLKFEKDAEFLRSTFEKDAQFNGSTFGGRAIFISSTFQDSVMFDFSTFKDNVTFGGHIYEEFEDGTFDYWESVFKGSASFVNSTFEGDAEFFSSTFEGATYFRKSIFLKRASFSQSRAKYISFQDVIFESVVDLNWKDFESMDIMGTVFKSHVNLDWNDRKVEESISKKLEEDHPNIDMVRKEICKEFITLKEKYRSQGEYEFEDNAYVAFKRMERKTLSLPNYALSLFADKIGKYGTSPKRVAMWMPVIVLFFGILYVIIGTWWPSNFTVGDNIFLESLYTSGIIFITIGFTDMYPVEIIPKLLVVAEGFIGLFMMAYFTICFSRKVLR